GGSTSAAPGGFGPFQQYTSGERDRKDFSVRDVVKAGVNLNRRAAPRGHAHRLGDGLELRRLRPGIHIRARGGVHVENRGAGALASAALLVGIVPWRVVAGVAMVSAGLTQAQAVAMSVLVFAGTAQLAVLPLLIAKAPLWVMIATALVVNLRYVIYSAVLAPHFEHLPRRWRVLLSYVTVDGMFALFAGRYRPDDGNRHNHWYFLGGSLVMWCAWQLSSGIGIFAGAMIPAE